MKLIFSSFLIGFVTFFGMGQSTEAADVNLQNMTPTKAENIYYDEEYGGYYDVYSGGYIDVYKVEDGKVVEKVDMEDYIERQAVEPNLPFDDSLYNSSNGAFNDEPLSDGPLNEISAVTYRYNETSSSTRIQYGKKASRTHQNCGPGKDVFDMSYSSSQGHSFSINLLAGEKSAVKSGVSYTWSNSASISSKHEMEVFPKYEGYFRFDPKVKISYGTVYRYNGPLTSSKKVSATYPVKLADGQLDGNIVSVKTKITCSPL